MELPNKLLPEVEKIGVLAAYLPALRVGRDGVCDIVCSEYTSLLYQSIIHLDINFGIIKNRWLNRLSF